VINFTNDILDINYKLFNLMNDMKNIDTIDVQPTPKSTELEFGNVKLYHYDQNKDSQKPHPPLLIVYALVNKYYMMDLQADKSFIKRLLDQGLDIYIIDWGYPERADRYLTMEDYIDGFINNCVDYLRDKHKLDAINLLGVCQGGTFSVIYSALYPEKIKNLVTMVTPVDFDVEDGLLNVWSKYIDIDALVDSSGNVSGDFMNIGYLMLKPFQLNFEKYYNFVKDTTSVEDIKNFLRMEKWIFDSPAQAGEAYRKFLKDLYQGNKLVKGEFTLNGRKVNLKNISMPLLTIYAEQDHLVPPASTKPLNDLVSSKDKTMLSFKGGHIGLYVSSKSQKELAPSVGKWIFEHSLK